jgi:hypothetical protein
VKKDKIIYWSATIFIVLFEGFMPLATLLFAKQYATAGTQPLGYPDYFAYALIICKVLGCIAISAPNISSKLREWAYAGFTFNLLFATLSHAVVDQNIGFILMPLVILAILAVSYFYNDKIKKQTINQ